MFSFIILFVIMLATIYISLVYVNASIMLVLYMEAVYFVLSLIYVTVCRFKVSGKIRIPVGISEVKRKNLIKINIYNKSFLPVGRIKAIIIVNDTLKGKKKKHKMKMNCALRGNNEYINYMTFEDAGNYEITLKKLRIYDITGIMYRDIPVKQKAAVQIMPEIYDVNVKITSVTRNFFGESDVYDENNPGYDNNEIFQVREYQKGDRLQNIHWKMTAKQDEIMVKEHSLPKACPVVFFLDFKTESKNKKMLLRCFEAAVSISFALMEAGCSHYVVWYDGEKSDISRIRIDNEESLYYFIGMMMKVKWLKPKEAIVERYKRKYRAENYVWDLLLNGKLQLIREKGENILFNEKELEKSLAEAEIIL